MFRRRFFLPLALALAWLALPSAADAQPFVAGHADCSTPRRALETWLANLQPDDPHPEVATRCFDWRDAGVATEARPHVAEQLKEVLDARGLWIEMSDIPDDATVEGTERIVPFPIGLEDLHVDHHGDRWLISAETVAAVPALHQATFALDIDDLLDRGPAFLRIRLPGRIESWQVLAIFFVVVLGLVVRLLSIRVLSGQLVRAIAHRRLQVDGELVRRAASPVGTLLAVLLYERALPTLRFGVGANQVIGFALRVAAAVVAVLLVYRLIDLGSDVWKRHAARTETKLDDQLVPLVRKAAKVTTVVIGIIFVLQNLEVDVASLIAGASLGGLAFSLAARDTVANLFGSASIFADRPFQVGDWVKLEGVEGTVEEVGVRSTRIRTFYRSVVTMPNSKVADAIIDNFGRRDARRDSFRLSVLYSTSSEQIEAFCDGIRAILHANPKVQKTGFEVHFAAFAESGLEILVYYFLVVDGWSDELRQRHLIYLEFLRLAESLGVDFAFPTRTLHVASHARPTDAVSPPRPSAAELTARIGEHALGGARARPAGPHLSPGYYPEAAQAAGPEPDGQV